MSAVQSPPVGVINWPRNHELLGWSAASPIPGWANVSPQAQRARQMSLSCFYSGHQVERRKWLSVWVEVSGGGGGKKKGEREGEPVASEGMF